MNCDTCIFQEFCLYLQNTLFQLLVVASESIQKKRFFSLINCFVTVYHEFYSFRSVSVVDIHGNFLGAIFQGAVAQGKSFRGNCLGRKIPGVIVLGGFHRW